MASLSREAHVVPVVPGELGLEREDPLRPSGRVVHLGQAEHPLEEVHVLVADLGEGVLPVVGLVGQAEAALLEEDEVAFRVARVIVDEELEEPVDALALEPAEGGQQRIDGLDRGDRAQQRRQRRGAKFFGARLVHEAGVEVAELARLGARLSGLGLDDDVAHRLLRLLGQHVERPVPGLVRRDFGARNPLAVDVAEQIVLGPDARIQFLEENSGFQGAVDAHGSSLCEWRAVVSLEPAALAAPASASALP